MTPDMLRRHDHPHPHPGTEPARLGLVTTLLLALVLAAAGIGGHPPSPVLAAEPSEQDEQDEQDEVGDDGLTPAPAHLPQTPRVDITPQVVDLTFPVGAPVDDTVWFTDDFLALRGGGARLHAATDVMAPKHRPLHAAVGGVITFAPYPEPHYGWMVSVRGDDGRRYSYVHLNNDTPARDADGRWLDDDAGGMEHAYAPRIVDAIRAVDGSLSERHGIRVERGELLGWVGDSGNAKGVAPHLHFEIHARDAEGEYRINPYHSLVAALEDDDVPEALPPREVVAAPEPAPAEEPAPGPDASDGGTPSTGFGDVAADNVHADAIARLTDAGVMTACEPARFCPHTPITRGDLAAAVAAVRGLTPTGTPPFSDVEVDDPNAGAIAVVDRAGLLRGYGDGRFGPDAPLSRGQLATVLVRTFDLLPTTAAPPFTDVSADAVHAPAIAAVALAGITSGCGDGTRYCAADPVSRAQIASLLDAGGS